MCPECARRHERELEALRATVANQQAALDAMTDALDDAEELCRVLAERLELLDPDHWQTWPEDDLELWDSVAPYGVEQ